MQNLQKEMSDQDIVWLSIVSSAQGKQGHITKDQAKELTKQRSALILLMSYWMRKAQLEECLAQRQLLICL